MNLSKRSFNCLGEGSFIGAVPNISYDFCSLAYGARSRIFESLSFVHREVQVLGRFFWDVHCNGGVVNSGSRENPGVLSDSDQKRTPHQCHVSSAGEYCLDLTRMSFSRRPRCLSANSKMLSCRIFYYSLAMSFCLISLIGQDCVYSFLLWNAEVEGLVSTNN